MGQKLIIAPNEFLFSYAGLTAEKVEQGALALNLDWAEEPTESSDYGTVIKKVVSAEAPHTSIVMCQEGDEAAQHVNALLMSPQDYIVTFFVNTLPEKADVKEALKSWNNYFKALQQHQYLFGEQFTIQLVPTSSLSQEQQALSNAVRCALQSDIEASELLQQFEGFSAAAKSQSWVDAVCYGLEQYKNIESTKNEYEKASAEFNTTKSEKETVQKELTQKAEEVAQLTQQVEALKNELESAANEVTNTKNAASELEAKYKDASSELASNKDQNASKKSEHQLLLVQSHQIQEELEATFLELSNLKADFKRIEQHNKQLQENARAEEVASAQDKAIAKKITDLEDEKALLLLQVSQLQEELKSTFSQTEESKKAKDALIQNLETKLAQVETYSPELQRELENAMSEQQLMQIQVQKLQEELEFYFTEYQKLKGESPDNKALAEFKSKIEERFPHLVLSESVTLTGGANQKDLQRITARFKQVEHGDKQWNAFSIIVNDRKGVLDIELHAPDKKRVYPLSKFVKTGSNKVCDFSLLSPFTDAGKKVLAELPPADHLLLIGIIEELQTKLEHGDVHRTEATVNLDIAPWPKKLLNLATALKQLAPKQAQKPLNFKKLSLKQNMVGATNEHLLISIENLQTNGTSYPAFDIKVGAKQIKDKAFTEYGSLEFRELANNQAPLATWPPETKDKWGLKLVLDLPAQLNEQQQNAINSLKEEDKLFIKELLTKLADRLHTLDRKKLKVNQPLENWQKLITGMVAKF